VPRELLTVVVVISGNIAYLTQHIVATLMNFLAPGQLSMADVDCLHPNIYPAFTPHTQG
jgi:hypothetical protein